MNGACSLADLKGYTQYAMQDSPSYPGRYLISLSVVSGRPMYTRTHYPENNGRYRGGQFTGHQGYNRRFHSRVLGEVIPCDFNIQYDSLIECRRPEIMVVLKKKKECKIIDIAVPGDSRIGEKELEKMEKYDDLKREIKRMWVMRKIEVIPIVVGALGAVSRKLGNWIEKLDVDIRIELLQKTALFGTARTLRRSLES